MIQTTMFDNGNLPQPYLKQLVTTFLHTHLEEYGDKLTDIEKAYDFATGSNGSPGGKIVLTYDKEQLVGCAIVNATGMTGYIPEHILVYIATHNKHRGKGIAGKIMQEVISNCEGNIALHVEPSNPALNLYEKFGFSNKYLEMRLNKKEAAHGIRHA